VNKKATRTKQYSGTAGDLYLAFELGSPNWILGFSVGLAQKPRRRAIPARNLEALQKEIAAAKKRFHLEEGARVLSCYEAGRDGFWLHRHLVSVGVDNIIVDSASIEVNRRRRRAKTDRLDAEKLIRMLIRFHLHGEKKIWSVVRVPSVEEEDRRQLNRERQALKKEKDRTMNRIRGLLATQGIKIKPRTELTPDRLAQIRTHSGFGLPKRIRNRIQREWEHVAFLKNQLAVVEKERRMELRQGAEPDVEKIKALRKFKGIGDVGSWVIVREFFGWRKFRNRKEVGSLAGLTATPFNSGEGKKEQGISKAGSRHVRAIAIELAWTWIQFQPRSALTQWFMKRFAKGGTRYRKVGIVALARRLLITLWKFLETGVIPEGAELKANA
jgi:transposase